MLESPRPIRIVHIPQKHTHHTRSAAQTTWQLTLDPPRTMDEPRVHKLEANARSTRRHVLMMGAVAVGVVGVATLKRATRAGVIGASSEMSEGAADAHKNYTAGTNHSSMRELSCSEYDDDTVYTAEIW